MINLKYPSLKHAKQTNISYHYTMIMCRITRFIIDVGVQYISAESAYAELVV